MFGQKQQIDALSEESFSRLINDLKIWLGINERPMPENKLQEAKFKTPLAPESSEILIDNNNTQKIISRSKTKKNISEDEKQFEIKDMRFSTYENILNIDVAIFSRVSISSSWGAVRILYDDRYFFIKTNFRKNQTTKVKFPIKGSEFKFAADKLNELKFIIQVLNHGEVKAEKKGNHKSLFRTESLFKK